MNPLARKIADELVRNNQIEEGDGILIALSGGMDSVCLLHLFCEIRKHLSLRLYALHVHHGIRGEEADRDSSFCESLCQKWEVSLATVYADVPALAEEQKLSLEEAARKVRYEALEEERKKRECRWILSAHHREDNAETILWNLLRGAGLRGMGGMKQVNGHLLRPLLSTGKEELICYAAKENLSWCEDSTNQSDDYTRNRIRHHLMPFLKEEINEKSIEHLCRTAETAAQADRYLEKQAAGWIQSYGESAPWGLSLPTHLLLEEEPILQAYILREACDRCVGLKNLEKVHIDSVMGLYSSAAGRKGSKELSLPHGLLVRREYDRLLFRRTGEEKKSEETEEIEIPIGDLLENIPYQVSYQGNLYEFCVKPYDKIQKIPSNQYTKWLSYDTLSPSVTLRSRKAKDYFLLGKEKKKTVKSYLIDEKVPAASRNQVPLLAKGNHILWLVGYRIDDEAKLREDTEKMVEITVHKGENHGNHKRVDFRAGSEQENC